MDAMELLRTEHRVIEQVLDALEAYAGRIERGEAVDVPEVVRFAEFVREFADACHHGKEEDILFAAMEEAASTSTPRGCEARRLQTRLDPGSRRA